MSADLCPCQFVVDGIPNENLDEFLGFMENFQKKYDCRFQYKEGKSVKHRLIPLLPNKEGGY